METWAWLAAYVVAFGLLQLVLYRYFQRESAETTPSASDRRRGTRPERPSEHREDAVRCRHCGAYNERHQTITFCRDCVGSLE